MFSTIKFALSTFYCDCIAQEEQRLWTIPLSAPDAPPLKDADFIFIVVSPSLRCSAILLIQDTFDHDKEQKSAILGRRLLFFLNFSSGFLLFLSRFSLEFSSGKEKTHKHKQICGIVPGLGGCQKFVYVFFSGHSLGGEKTHKQNSPQNPGTIP